MQVLRSFLHRVHSPELMVTVLVASIFHITCLQRDGSSGYTGVFDVEAHEYPPNLLEHGRCIAHALRGGGPRHGHHVLYRRIAFFITNGPDLLHERLALLICPQLLALFYWIYLPSDPLP